MSGRCVSAARRADRPRSRNGPQARANCRKLLETERRDGVQNRVVFPDGARAGNPHSGKQAAALLDEIGQVLAHMATLAKKNRHDGDVATPAGNLFRDGGRQIGRHQFEKGE